jgi:hypothetical protein
VELWIMVKEGGLGAMLALGLGILGLGVAIACGVVLAMSRRAAFATGLVALALAVLAPTAGVLGMMAGRHTTERALEGAGVSRVTADRIRKEGYRESQGAAKIGFGAAVVPLLAGAIAALLASRERSAPTEPHDPRAPWASPPRANGRALAASVAAVFALLAAGGAFAAGAAPLPRGKYDFDVDDRHAWALADARERVETDFDAGCDELDTALVDLWEADSRIEWPRTFRREPDELVPDARATAKRCAQAIWNDVKAKGQLTRGGSPYPVYVGRPARTWDRDALLASPLLLDEALYQEVLAATRLSAFGMRGELPFGGDIGDPLRAPSSENVLVGDPTVSGRLPAAVIRRIVGLRRSSLRACYDRATVPELRGKVLAKVTISSAGAVSNVSDAGSDLPDAAVRKCALDQLYGLSFPAPEGGVTVATVPITFEVPPP